MSARFKISAGLALPLLAAGLLAGCNKADNASADNTIVVNGDAPAITNEADATAPADEVSIAPLPIPAAGTAAAEAAPVQEAQSVASAIEQDKSVVRVRHEDGWAWVRNGQVIRTASRDGKNVAYFHPGDPQPFFVQKDDKGYALNRGQVTRRFDRDGKAKAPDSGDRHDAEDMARDATRQLSEARDAAEHAADRRDARKQANALAHGPSPAPTATPSPQHSRRDSRAGPVATPSPDAGEHRRDRGDRSDR